MMIRSKVINKRPVDKAIPLSIHESAGNFLMTIQDKNIKGFANQQIRAPPITKPIVPRIKDPIASAQSSFIQ